jgi:PBSX family phage terminase large subunit
MSTAVEEVRIPAPTFRGGNLALGSCRDLEVCLDGPAGCVAGETLIYNPVTSQHTPIKELYEKKIAPTVQTMIGAIQAEVPFCKGVERLYRVTLASGRECVVTGNHLVLTPDGWRFVSACVPGSRLLISSPCPRPTTEAPGPSVSRLDAFRLSQTPLGSQEHYSAYCYPYGAPHLTEEDSDLTGSPSQGDAPVHSRGGLYEDDLDSLSGYSRHNQQSDHHARTYCSPSPDDREHVLSDAQPGTSLLIDVLFQSDAPSPREKHHLSPTAQFQLDDDSTRHHALSLGELPSSEVSPLHGALTCAAPGQLELCFLFVGMTQELSEVPLELHVYNPSLDTSHSIKYTSKCDYTIQWDTVSSIKYERTDEYFDLHVPIAEHYLAEGIWHHNTGKTYAALYKVHLLLTLFSGAKALVARKTNTALAGSALATYRDMVDIREGVRYFGGNKVRPSAFEYPNGSQLIVNGLDKPDKVKSWEFDIALVNEATECEEEDVEFVRSRLRHGKLPYHQLMMDVNPGPPNHWLNVRMNSGKTTRLLSRHEDNPRYFDINTGTWTQEGYDYIEGVLGGLTGVRLARLRYGIWASAEGTVYEDTWDRARNIINHFTIPPEWPRYLAVDFGFTNPFVCLWAAQDPDGRLYIYRQIYRTKTLVEDHAKVIRQLSKWGQPGGDPLPRAIICDHDAEDRATLERHLGLRTLPAQKNVSAGIQAVASRFKAAGDNRPRVMILRDSLAERDMELVAKKAPCCLEDEPESYIWDVRQGMKHGEAPVKDNDHGLDSLRYLCAYFDLIPSTVAYSNRIY